MHACVCAQSCPLCTPIWAIAHQAPLPMELRQEYWSGLPFSPSGNPPDPGIESTFPASCVLADGSWENCLKHSRSSNHRFSDLNACDGWKETGKIFLGTYLSGLIIYKIII